MDLLDTKIKLKETRSLFKEKRDETEAAIEAGDVDKAKELKAEVDKIRTDLDGLTAKVEELEKDKEEDENKQDETEENNDKTENGDEQRMAEEVRVITGGTQNEQRDAFQKYLETRAIEGDITTESGYVVVPEEVITEVMKLKQSEFQLSDYVTVRQVNNGSGKQPVVSRATTALPSVEELAENPKLAVTPFINVQYDVKTYRGYLQISRELIEDSAVNVLAEVQEYLARLIVATENKNILDKLKELSATQAVGTDGIKDVLNVDLDPVHGDRTFIMGQSAFNEIDKLVDGNGRYLLQDSITSASGKMLFGNDVAVMKDSMFPNKSGKFVFYVGDFKEGIALFDRSRYQVGWENYSHYGECLMVSTRHDVQFIDKSALRKVEFSVPVEEEPAV